MNTKYKSYIIIGVVLLIVVIIAAWYVSARNGLVAADEGLKKQWAEVEVQYQRRLDLIPNLVRSVTTATDIETSSVEKVTKARSAGAELLSAVEAAQKVNGGNALSSQEAMDSYLNARQAVDRSLGIYVNAVHEAYPDYKSISQFQDLNTQLEGTENRIATERMRYTDCVKEYNTLIRKFPVNLVASIGGFDKKPQFEAEAGAEKAPEVQF